MRTGTILSLLIAFYLSIYVTRTTSQTLPDYPLQSRMMECESALLQYFIESSYTRIIIWNTSPRRQELQSHFDKFELLQLKEEWLLNPKFDFIEKSKTTYERFLYIQYPDEQSFVTVFVKLNLDNEKHSFLSESSLEQMNSIFKKYGLIDGNENAPSPVNSENSVPLALFTIIILSISSYLIWLKFNQSRKLIEKHRGEQQSISPNAKNEDKQKVEEGQTSNPANLITQR
jgi:hypothetical protein